MERRSRYGGRADPIAVAAEDHQKYYATFDIDPEGNWIETVNHGMAA